MKMLTAAIKRALPALYATDGVPADQKVVPLKFFQPWGSWTWYAVEGEEQEGGDWLFFGYVDGMVGEWGYFSLRELESVRGPFGLRIERDLHWNPQPFGEIRRGVAA